MPNTSSPYVHAADSVTVIMLRVIYALIPGVAAYAWFFGWGVLINVLFAVVVALACEAVMLALRDRPLKPFLLDGSAVVTAVLLALALPPLAPWWLVLSGTAFAIIIAKQLYGGLGFNPFNPAMVGYVVLLISFPREMTVWLSPEMVSGHSFSLADSLAVVFTGQWPTGLTLDAVSAATPLDSVKTGLSQGHVVGETLTTNPLFGSLGGKGWEWINGMFLLGGLWLIYKKVIGWHIPVAVLGTLAVLAGFFYLVDQDTFASPVFHLFSGAALLGAFFIATDPVTASTTPRGRIYYGVGIGAFTYIIRTWGGYPEGIAFAVLLMNMAAPLIDYYTQPRTYGHKD